MYRGIPLNIIHQELKITEEEYSEFRKIFLKSF